MSHSEEVLAWAQSAELNAQRLRRLVRVAASLSSAPTAREVAEVVVDAGKAAISADTGGVWLVDHTETNLELVAWRDFPPPLQRAITTYPLGANNPLCQAVRTGEALWVGGWDEFARRFPESEARMRHIPEPRPNAFACLPLRIEREIIGGMVFGFFAPHAFDEDERAFIELLAQHCAQGVERARLYEQALEAIRVRDDFLSVAGHELRTPLSTLLLQIQFLIGGAEPPGGVLAERCAPVLRTLRRLIKLADDLLDVSRIRAGRMRLELEPLELEGLVRDVVARVVEGRRGGNEIRIDSTGRVEGHWDPLRIEQVVTNLVNNACKYGGNEPVDVRVGPCPLGAEIVVRDRGIGIAPADQARIFERFERSVEPREFAGLGLGLWIASEIAKAHGGTIGVRSELGHGAEFTVQLPLKPPAARWTSALNR